MRFLAYIDPGIGSIIIQAIIGGLLAIIVTFRNYIRLAFHKIKSFFGHSKKATPKDEKKK